MSGAAETTWVRELSRLADAASPGPWIFGTANDEAFMSAEFVSIASECENAWPPERSVIAITKLQLPRYAGNDLSEENARFIAAARMGVPRLCTELERALEKQVVLVDAMRKLLAVTKGTVGAVETGNAIERAQRLVDDLKP